jgi:hypothetical protein
VIFTHRPFGHQAALALVLRAAGWTSSGLVLETFGGVELLLTDGEQKLLAAVPARQRLVRQAHSANLLSSIRTQ